MNNIVNMSVWCMFICNKAYHEGIKQLRISTLELQSPKDSLINKVPHVTDLKNQFHQLAGEALW